MPHQVPVTCPDGADPDRPAFSDDARGKVLRAMDGTHADLPGRPATEAFAASSRTCGGRCRTGRAGGAARPRSCTRSGDPCINGTAPQCEDPHQARVAPPGIAGIPAGLPTDVPKARFLARGGRVPVPPPLRQPK